MSAPLGFAAAVRAHGDDWRIYGACDHYKAARTQVGDAILGADTSLTSDRRDFHLMRDFLPGGMYASRSRAWGGRNS